jgi:hypothetical protein
MMMMMMMNGEDDDDCHDDDDEGEDDDDDDDPLYAPLMLNHHRCANCTSQSGRTNNSSGCAHFRGSFSTI